jgi:hypothetical protein
MNTVNGTATPYIYDLTIAYDYNGGTVGTGTFPYRMYWDTSWIKPVNGFMGSSNGTSVTCDTNYSGDKYSGSTSTKFTYNKSVETWAGIYCLYNGWNGPGINLTGNKRLTFFAKSSVSGVKVKFGLGATSSNDTAAKSTMVTLNTTWQKVTLDMAGLNLGSINGLWYFSIAASDNTSIASPITFYVDEVSYDEMSPTSLSSIFAAPADPSFAEGETYVYPNPAKEGKKPVIHVEVGVADSLQINIYDVAGDLLTDVEITDTPGVIDDKYAYEYEWNISGKPSGTYIARIVATKGSDKLKITKKFAVVK